MFLHRKIFGGKKNFVSFTCCQLVILSLELPSVKEASVELHDLSVSIAELYAEELVRGMFVHKYCELEKFTQNSP
jgi:hypothetical protein